MYEGLAMIQSSSAKMHGFLFFRISLVMGPLYLKSLSVSRRGSLHTAWKRHKGRQKEGEKIWKVS